MKKTDWLWLCGGVIYGVSLRYIFGTHMGNDTGPMSVAFLLATPFTVGAITIYGARKNNPSITYMMFFPWVTTLLMLLGCALTLMEGAICIAILTPLFLLCSSIGGLIMGGCLRAFGGKDHSLKAIVLLPFLVAIGEGHVPLHEQEIEIKQSIAIKADPKTIWNQIMVAKAIKSDELPLSLTHLIGVPKPLEGINIQTTAGETRFSKWEKGVNFQADVVSRNEFKTITWHYVFNENSFPAGSMDDHVAIGGRYFDLNDTTFNLIPLQNGETQLEIVAHYKVNSAINFYSIPVTKVLGSDFVNTILVLYKHRSEDAAAPITREIS